LSFLRQVTTNTTAIPAPAGVNNPTRNLFQSWGDEYARELLNKDFSNRDGTQSITTFAVGVIGANSDPRNSTSPPFDGFFSYLDSVARYGGSPRYQNSAGNPSYFYPALGPGAIADAIDRIFDRVLSANTVFTSAALPISVSTQGTYKNQVFIGMFRPDELMRPRWYGNLKQYKFAFDSVSNVLSLVDSAGNAAISAVTGYVEPSAVSYWSSPSTFWVNAPRGTVNPTSDSPDGEVAEKGGAAQRQREAFATSQAGRNVYTCVGCAAEHGAFDRRRCAVRRRQQRHHRRRAGRGRRGSRRPDQLGPRRQQRRRLDRRGHRTETPRRRPPCVRRSRATCCIRGRR